MEDLVNYWSLKEASCRYCTYVVTKKEGQDSAKVLAVTATDGSRICIIDIRNIELTSGAYHIAK